MAAIKVALNTDLKGSVIATIDADGNDTNNVCLTTGALTASDIADHDKSTSMSIGLGNISATQSQQTTKTSSNPVMIDTAKDQQ